jgi:hypothetical protein
MNLLLWNQRGQSLVQIMIAVGIMGILMLGMTSLFEIFHKQQNQSNLVFQAGMLRNNLVAALNNPVGWKNTTSQSANNFTSGVMLDCLNNGKPCTTDQTTDLAGGGTPVGYSGGAPTDNGVLIRQVLDSSGAVILDSTNPNTGYTPQGASCSTFNAATGSGDDLCPLRFEVHWWANCNSVVNTCVNAQPELKIFVIYNPRKQVHAFNPANYGTPKFLQGQEPGGLCWQLVGTVLYESCSTAVGIGTSNPGTTLEINPGQIFNTRTINDAFGPFVIQRKARNTGIVQNGDELGYMRFDGYDGAAYRPGANIGVLVDGTPGPSDMPGALSFKTTPDGSSTLIERMRINNAGAVGIGTISPAATLDVYDWGGAGAQIRTTNNSSTRTSGIDFFSTGPFAYGFVGFRNVGSAAPAVAGVWLNSGDAYPVIFGTTTLPGPATERMRITPAGNVGIGTTAPTLPFEVSGFSPNPSDAPTSIQNTNPQGTSSVSFKDIPGTQKGAVGYGLPTGTAPWAGNAYLSTSDATSIVLITNSNERVRVDGSGNVGIGTASPSQKLEVSGNVAAQSFINTSDRREKTNIVPLGEAGSVLQRLDSIHGVYFDWKSSGEKSIGVIAQDVTREFPALVDRHDDRRWKVNYGGLVAVVLEAVKELRDLVLGSRDKIDALERQDRLLKTEISSLRAEVDSLRLRVAAKEKTRQK